MKLFKHLKVWGVELESNLPPEFFITEHAEQRLKERIGVSSKKMKQVVVKAWYSKDVNIKKLKKAQYKQYWHEKEKYKQPRICRELMGYVFIFVLGKHRKGLNHQKILITVI